MSGVGGIEGRVTTMRCMNIFEPVSQAVEALGGTKRSVLKDLRFNRYLGDE